MTSRDTHDIDEYEREKKATGTNVQPGLLIKLMAESEPCLFSNKSPVAVVPYRPNPKLLAIRDRMMDVARWHAQLQVSFDRNLAREALAVAHDQG